ncbi:MAG TPA: hypothetical protein PLZ93_00470 [Nocardioides sp.]|uniref:hypothetical protein n=1 Tax=uncultured Nocardioides sp. TaxID=198441 RepID=UPI00260AC678|nr:hypothetical protein [uncultured Nocardioides sp.]HRD63862.1 hypothetical protein [Nocardioides sp.]HRI94066.1 hypothetical protein [Nocardioides sp.]HRK44127.1 hypothetical protein [Nocardioides sp.]
MTSLTFIAVTRARVEVDPGALARRDPTLSVASIDDADRPVSVGEVVWAVQTDDEDGTEAIAPATVVEVNTEFRLLHLRVDWQALEERPIGAPPIDFGNVTSLRTGGAVEVLDLQYA